MKINKICQKCSKEMKQVYHTKRYCEDCLLILKKHRGKKYYSKSFKEKYKQDELEQIKKLYLEGNSVRSISIIINHGDKKIISGLLKEMGIKVLEQPLKKLNMEKDEIINLYTNGKSMKEISKKLKVSDGLIKRLLLRNNIKINRDISKRVDIDNRKEEILNLYLNNNSISKIAELMNCDYEVVKRILLEENIEIKPTKFYTKGKSSKCRAIKNEQEVIDMYIQDITGIDIAKHFNCHYSTIYDILKRNNIEIKGTKHFLKGKESFNKNKTYEEIYGEDKAKELKEKLRLGTLEVMKNPEHRKKLGEIRRKGYEEGRIKKFLGEESHKWLGGKSFEPYTPEFNKEFRYLIRFRDNFCCINCGISEQKQIFILGRKLTVHHIDYNKLNTCLTNCCSLCVSCNTLANQHRGEWTEYYREKLTKLYGYQYKNLEVLN